MNQAGATVALVRKNALPWGMRRIGVFYATREGQTRRVAEYISNVLSDGTVSVRFRQFGGSGSGAR